MTTRRHNGSGKPPSGRWLAYGIPLILMAITAYQGFFKDSIDFGLLGFDALFVFGAMGWSLDDVAGSRMASNIRGHVVDQLEEHAQAVDPGRGGGEEGQEDQEKVQKTALARRYDVEDD